MRGDIPLPSENQHWPAWFYPPDVDPENPSALGQVFNSPEDVPAGWAHDYRAHGENLNREPPAPPADSGMTRNELKDELARRDIAFAPTAAKAELQRLLDEALESERLEDSI